MRPSEKQARLRRELGRRLARVRGRVSQEAYADELGVHVNTLARYERGERWPTGDFLRQLASRGVDLHWLLTGEVAADGTPSVTAGHQPRRDNGEGNGVAEMPAAYTATVDETTSTAPKADRGAVTQQRVAAHFDERWLHQRWGLSQREACMVQVQGDSMEPTLKSGDQVLVDRREAAVEHDGLYLLRLGQGMIVRRLQRLPHDRCKVLSANPAYAPFTIDLHRNGAECQVLGRVLWVGQCL